MVLDVSMQLHGVAWCSAWCYVVLRGAAWCCVVLRGAAWGCVGLRGAAWGCVGLRGAAWGCVGLRGVLRGVLCAAWSAAWRCMVPHGCYMMLRGWDDGMIGWWMMDDGTCASREEKEKTRASLHKPLPPQKVARLLRQGAHQALIIAILSYPNLSCWTCQDNLQVPLAHNHHHL